MSPTGSNNWTGTFTVGAWARRGPWRIRSVCLHDLIGHQLLSTSNALGERSFADRPGYALRQGCRWHALNIEETALCRWLWPFGARMRRKRHG